MSVSTLLLPSIYHVRISFFVYNSNIVEFNVEELVDRFQSASDSKIVLQFHRHLLIHQSFEERVEELVVSKKQSD